MVIKDAELINLPDPLPEPADRAYSCMDAYLRGLYANGRVKAGLKDPDSEIKWSNLKNYRSRAQAVFLECASTCQRNLKDGGVWKKLAKKYVKTCSKKHDANVITGIAEELAQSLKAAKEADAENIVFNLYHRIKDFRSLHKQAVAAIGKEPEDYKDMRTEIEALEQKHKKSLRKLASFYNNPKMQQLDRDIRALQVDTRGLEAEIQELEQKISYQDHPQDRWRLQDIQKRKMQILARKQAELQKLQRQYGKALHKASK